MRQVKYATPSKADSDGPCRMVQAQWCHSAVQMVHLKTVRRYLQCMLVGHITYYDIVAYACSTKYTLSDNFTQHSMYRMGDIEDERIAMSDDG